MDLVTRLRTHTDAISSAAFVVLWSSGFVGAELASRSGADPLTVLAWRFTALTLLLLVVSRLLGHRPGLAAWRRQAGIGLLCQVTYLGLVFEGVAHGVPGGTAALVAALQPLVVATVAGRLLGETTSPRGWVGLGLGLVGVGMVVGGDVGAADVPVWAYLLPFGAMLSLGSGTVLERRLRPRESLLEVITIQSTVAAIAFMTMAATIGEAAPPATVRFWTAVGWLFLLSSLGGYGAYVFVSRRRGATAVSTLLYLTPPTTMLWVFAMFGRPVTLLGLAGLLVSGVGVTLALRDRRGAEHRTASIDRNASPA